MALKKKNEIRSGAEASRRELIITGTQLQTQGSAMIPIKRQCQASNTRTAHDTAPAVDTQEWQF